MPKYNLSRYLFLVFLFSLFTASNSLAETELNQRKAKNWVLHTADNSRIDYYQTSKNKLSVLLFWASWCPYCHSLMPHLQELADEFQYRNVDFYALNIFEDGDPIAYMKKQGYSFTSLLTADLVAEDYGVLGTPALYVVDENKYILYQRKSGASDEQLKRDVRAILETRLDKLN